MFRLNWKRWTDESNNRGAKDINIPYREREVKQPRTVRAVYLGEPQFQSSAMPSLDITKNAGLTVLESRDIFRFITLHCSKRATERRRSKTKIFRRNILEKFEFQNSFLSFITTYLRALYSKSNGIGLNLATQLTRFVN